MIVIFYEQLFKEEKKIQWGNFVLLIENFGVTGMHFFTEGSVMSQDNMIQYLVCDLKFLTGKNMILCSMTVYPQVGYIEYFPFPLLFMSPSFTLMTFSQEMWELFPRDCGLSNTVSLTPALEGKNNRLSTKYLKARIEQFLILFFHLGILYTLMTFTTLAKYIRFV